LARNMLQLCSMTPSQRRFLAMEWEGVEHPDRGPLGSETG
jgi:hypothetical protein